MNVKELIDEWYESKKEYCKKSTIANFYTNINRYHKPYFSEMNVDDLNNKVLKGYLEYLYGVESISIKSANGLMHEMCNIMRFAFEKGYIEEFEIRLKYRKQKKYDQVVCFTKEETKKFIEQCSIDTDYKKLGFLITIMCGLRMNEICALQFSDVDFINSTISISKGLTYISVEGKNEIIIDRPKTKTSTRIIPISEGLLRKIKELRTDDEQCYIISGTKKPLTPEYYRHNFSDFLKINGFKHIKFHGLRHTFAVRAMENEKFDIKNIAVVLGHESPSFTLEVYGRADLTQTRKCMNLMNKFIPDDWVTVQDKKLELQRKKEEKKLKPFRQELCKELRAEQRRYCKLDEEFWKEVNKQRRFQKQVCKELLIQQRQEEKKLADFFKDDSYNTKKMDCKTVNSELQKECLEMDLENVRKHIDLLNTFVPDDFKTLIENKMENKEIEKEMKRIKKERIKKERIKKVEKEKVERKYIPVEKNKKEYLNIYGSSFVSIPLRYNYLFAEFIDILYLDNEILIIPHQSEYDDLKNKNELGQKIFVRKYNNNQIFVKWNLLEQTSKVAPQRVEIKTKKNGLVIIPN